jgi:uncharacterized protein (DUF362 family)/NAD-dependent dihydropyrimidine dehydrogenase PreA subunit
LRKPKEDVKSMNSDVFLIQIDIYDQQRLCDAVEHIFQSLGLPRELAGGNVLVKPNMLVGASPENAVCTHPEVVRALIRNLPECCVKVGDSPGVGTTKMAALQTGILDVCRQEGAKLADFGDPVVTTLQSGAMCHSLPIASAVIEADFVISAAKLKTHALMRYTGAVKNLYGCVPGRIKAQMHLRMEKTEAFAGMLVDLYASISPVLSVVDGIVAMEGNGPRSGTPRQVGVLIAGRDGVAVDAVACSVVGIDPFSVLTTRLAHERGIGCGDLKEIRIIGTALQDVRVSGFKTVSGSASTTKNLPPFWQKLLREQLTARPHINSKDCTGCAICSEVCPAGAIVVPDKADIKYESCIRCYCCQEMCPQGVITLKKKGLGRLFR